MEKRLFLIRNLHIICFQKVFSNRHLISFRIHELICHWILIKDYILNNIGLFMTPISNNRFVLELSKNFNSLILDELILVNFCYSFQTWLVWEEFVDVVKYNSHSFLVVECCCPKSRACYYLWSFNLDLLIHIKVVRSSTNLSEVSFSKCLLKDVIN